MIYNPQYEGPEPDGPIIRILGFLYHGFKWFCYAMLLLAFLVSAQCQEQVNEICEETKWCEPDYERVKRLRKGDLIK